MLGVVEIDLDGRIAAIVLLDLEDFAPPSRSSTPDTSPAKRPPIRTRGRLISGRIRGDQSTGACQRPRRTWINVDHRRETAMGSGDLIAYSAPGRNETKATRLMSRPCIG